MTIKGNLGDHERIVRLKQAIRIAGGNQIVAARSGIPLSTLSSYISGREMKLSTAILLARICGVTLEWLATGNNASSENNSRTSTESFQEDSCNSADPFDDVIRLPIIPSDSALKDQQYFYFDKRLLYSITKVPPKHLSVYYASGSNMEPVIRHSDMLLINTTPNKIVEGRIYLFLTQDHYLIRKLIFQTDGNVILVSDNPQYSSYIIKVKNNIPWEKAEENSSLISNNLIIIGHVIWRSGLLFS